MDSPLPNPGSGLPADRSASPACARASRSSSEASRASWRDFGSCPGSSSVMHSLHVRPRIVRGGGDKAWGHAGERTRQGAVPLGSGRGQVNTLPQCSIGGAWAARRGTLSGHMRVLFALLLAAQPAAFHRQERTALLDSRYDWPAEAEAIPGLRAELRRRMAAAYAEARTGAR